MTAGRVVELVVLDVNETLSDLEPLRDRFVTGGLPGHLLETWFAATLRDGFALAAAGTAAPFRDVGAGALNLLLAGRTDLTGPAGQVVDGVLDGFATLQLHPDVEPGLRMLAEAGIRIVTLSNGSAAVAAKLFEDAGLSELVERRLSVDDVGHWKPHPASYAYAVEQCGLPADRMCLLATHPWDTDGAKRAGLRSAWLNRRGGPYPPVFLPADVTGPDLPSVAADLLEFQT